MTRRTETLEQSGCFESTSEVDTNTALDLTHVVVVVSSTPDVSRTPPFLLNRARRISALLFSTEHQFLDHWDSKLCILTGLSLDTSATKALSKSLFPRPQDISKGRSCLRASYARKRTHYTPLLLKQDVA